MVDDKSPKDCKKNVNKAVLNCPICGVVFEKYFCQITTKIPCCSKDCFSKRQKKMTPYERTLEHRQKMSLIIKNSPHKEQRQAIIVFNQFRKGKTFEEVYGEERAREIKLFYSDRMMGNKNINYIDGRSYEPYPEIFNRRLKAVIKKKDNYKCQNCDIEEIEIRKSDSLGRGLSIHHIDYDKHNCHEDNLISLCRVCHGFSHGNRKIIQAFYEKKIKQKEKNV